MHQAPGDPPRSASRRATTSLRVRYTDCDPMGRAHHSVYPVWFEIARTEQLRELGFTYQALEAAGALLVVAKLEMRFHAAAGYDELIEASAEVTRVGPRVIEHVYEIHRGSELLATGGSTLVSVNRQGRVQRMPSALQEAIALSLSRPGADG